MPADDLLREAQRVMTICNACRYCEGFCAVFPAMELRRVFAPGDLKYLANLCHNCRGCYYACQYAPPHEFMLNVPKTLAQLRRETYKEFARPLALGRLFEKNGRALAWITAGCLLLALGLTLGFQPRELILGVHQGERAFYKVIPYDFMVWPFLALGCAVSVFLVNGIISFWRGIGGRPRELWDWAANLRALGDALRLTYLGGGGHGCNYPDERFSNARRWLHQTLFYGFFLTGVSTALAALHDHFLGRMAPYPFWSWPVVLGGLGGLGIMAGGLGLLYLKAKVDRAPADEGALSMDIGFTVLLLLTALSGILLLLFRDTWAMGLLLAVHLGFVGAFFLSLPCGKFVHAVYRYAALVRNAQERIREGK